MKIDRLISIIMILLEKKRVGAKELANTFEVSLRTIYRDIETINISGIPVRSTPGLNGGFEIMKKYKINKHVFSNTDLSTLLIGFSSMPTVVNGQEVVNVLAKIKNLVPASSSKEIELNANQIHIDLEPWTYNRNIQMNLNIIKEALTDKKILLFDYYDHRGNETKRSIEPYQLVLKKSYWYLYGYCLTRKDYRLFKISRISKLQIQEQIFCNVITRHLSLILVIFQKYYKQK